MTRSSSQKEESESPDFTPLSVVILGTPESVQRVRLAIESGSTFGVSSTRSLHVAAVFSRSTLKISEPVSQGVDLVSSFIEESLSIANRMQKPNRQQPALRRSTQWLVEFANFCRIEHAIWAAPEQFDEESAILLREASQIFKYVWPASSISDKKIASEHP